MWHWIIATLSLYILIAGAVAVVLAAGARGVGEEVLLRDLWRPSLLWGWTVYKKATRRA